MRGQACPHRPSPFWLIIPPGCACAREALFLGLRPPSLLQVFGALNTFPATLPPSLSPGLEVTFPGQVGAPRHHTCHPAEPCGPLSHPSPHEGWDRAGLVPRHPQRPTNPCRMNECLRARASASFTSDLPGPPRPGSALGGVGCGGRSAADRRQGGDGGGGDLALPARGPMKPGVGGRLISV